MSDDVRVLFTFDRKTRMPIKAEALGEAGDLRELDQDSFRELLGGAREADSPACQQIVINIYGAAPGLPAQASKKPCLIPFLPFVAPMESLEEPKK